MKRQIAAYDRCSRCAKANTLTFSPEGIMSKQTHSSGSIRSKLVEEFTAMAAIAAYLYVCFGAVIIFKSSILRAEGIHYEIWGLAAVKALIMAKFMLIARMLHVGMGYRNKPLIWPTLYLSLMYLIVLLILTILEELIVGFIHSRAVADSLSHVVGPTFFQGLAVCLIMFLILVPFSAFTCLSEVLGEREMIRLFFVNRDVDDAVRNNLTGRVPPAQTSG
jgi:hypothetical protein